MKILKRNQLIILVVSLMLITAGYLNFSANQENTQTSVTADRNDNTIGDAQLVSTIPKENEEEKVENLLNGQNIQDTSNQLNETSTSSVLKDNVTNEEDNYFKTSKLERNTMYSELLESYQKIYNDINANADAKADALNNINKINNRKNAIMIAENLIIAKNFKDVVIFVNDNSVSVIIKAEELKTEQVAQIQNIVSRELSVDASTIHISNR